MTKSQQKNMLIILYSEKKKSFFSIHIDVNIPVHRILVHYMNSLCHYDCLLIRTLKRVIFLNVYI